MLILTSCLFVCFIHLQPGTASVFTCCMSIEGLLVFFDFRQQVTEIIFVLKAISTLMDSLKKTQPENGEYQTVQKIKQILVRGVIEKSKHAKTPLAVVCSFQINVSEYRWDGFSNEVFFFFPQSEENCLCFQQGQLPEIISLSAIDWNEAF